MLELLHFHVTAMPFLLLIIFYLLVKSYNELMFLELYQLHQEFFNCSLITHTCRFRYAGDGRDVLHRHYFVLYIEGLNGVCLFNSFHVIL